MPSQEVPAGAIQTSDAIVHLAGEPIAQKWNPEVKAKIRDSRVNGTRTLVASIAKHGRRPQALISASAIGYYGDRGDEVSTKPQRQGRDSCRKSAWNGSEPLVSRESWVARCVAANRNRSRERGRRLEANVDSVRLGVGGPIASGKQWMSWIHTDDLVSAMVFALGNPDLAGPVNATAPNPFAIGSSPARLGQRSAARQ